MLVQAILYGSFRFWLYFMVMPESVAKLIEQDAKQILWATEPQLTSNELGSERCRRWIHELASYIPTNQGGAGIMHWSSHCEAFYAHWIVRFLHPRKAPWKEIVRYWIQDTYIGDAVLVADVDRDDAFFERVPKEAHYLRRCLRAFDSLKLKQNLNLLDETIIAEPLWHNHRTQIKARKMTCWLDGLHVHHLSDLLSDQGRPFTRAQWDTFFDGINPNPRYKNEKTHFTTISTPSDTKPGTYQHTQRRRYLKTDGSP